MLSEFFGCYQKSELPNREFPHQFSEGSFSFFSTKEIHLDEEWMGCLHGQIFGQNFLQNPRSFFQKALTSIQGNLAQFHKDLDGPYFLIFFHRTTKTLYLLNNRYLATTCYYSLKNQALIFGNNLKEISDCLRKEKTLEIAKGALHSFLSNGFTMTDETQISGVSKFLPCFRLIHGRGTQIHHFCEDEYFFERKPLKNLDEAIHSYESIYQQGIRNFIDQTQPKELGTLLSGGHDTSFALIQATKVFPKPLHSFTVTFPGWAWDESKYAENISHKWGAKFHPIEFGPEDLDYIVSMVQGNQEPVVGSSLPLHKLSLFASKEVDTLLGGDGGDTLWGEYYPVSEYHRIVKNLPLFIRKFLYQTSKGLRKMTDWERFWELEHVSELFSHPNFYDDFMRRLCTYRHFNRDTLDKLLVPEQNPPSPLSPKYLVPFNRENFSEALIYGKLYNAFYTYQSFSTYRSIEHFGTPFYLPTINKDLIQFIGELPSEWLNGGTVFHRLTNNKTINRRFHKIVLSKYLKKEEIYNRSFDIPWYKILKPRTAVLERLEYRLKERGWYQEEALSHLFREFKNQNFKEYELLELKHHGYRIFTLLSLEIWAMEYLDNRRTSTQYHKVNLEDYLAQS